MLTIDMASIRKKADGIVKSKEFKREEQQYIQEALTGNIIVNIGNGSIHSAAEAAEKFIDVMRNHINTSGLSSNAAAAINDLSYGTPVCEGNRCTIKVFFEDTHRDSLAPASYPGGIDNLEELFDQGVGHKMRPVRGEWHGNTVWSRTTIPGTHFIDAAIRDFMTSYGTEYNVVDINVDYEH